MEELKGMVEYVEQVKAEVDEVHDSMLCTCMSESYYRNAEYIYTLTNFVTNIYISPSYYSYMFAQNPQSLSLPSAMTLIPIKALSSPFLQLTTSGTREMAVMVKKMLMMISY